MLSDNAHVNLARGARAPMRSPRARNMNFGIDEDLFNMTPVNARNTEAPQTPFKEMILGDVDCPIAALKNLDPDFSRQFPMGPSHEAKGAQASVNVHSKENAQSSFTPQQTR